MIEPLEMRIFEALRDRLAAIDPAAGYYGHVEDVAVKLDPDQEVSGLDTMPEDQPVIVIEPFGAERWTWEPAMQAIAEIGARISWLEAVIPDTPESSTAAPASTVDRARLLKFWRACADMSKALIANDPTLGGLVTDIRIADRRWNRAAYNGQTVVAEMDVAIKTRRDFLMAGGY